MDIVFSHGRGEDDLVAVRNNKHAFVTQKLFQTS